MDDNELPPNILILIEEFNRSGLRELHLRKGDFELLLSHADQPLPLRAVASPAPATKAAPIAPVQAPVAAKPSAAAAIPEGASVVRAPNLGTFYRSPKPGSPAFVEVGKTIAPGDELCLIEVMKLFTTVRSELAGTVLAVLVEDGTMVEADQPLFAIGAA